MKAIPNYGNSVVTIPGCVTDLLPSAPKDAVSVLIYILSADNYTVSETSSALSLSEECVLTALGYWEKCGVITNDIIPYKRKSPRTALPDVIPSEKKQNKMTSSLPTYTSEETARLLEIRPDVASLIDSCEQIIGKIFTTAETNIVLGLLDHLSLSSDYILLLFAHASKIGKNSVRYIEKLALSLCDRDVINYEELAEELASAETENTIDGYVKNLFGFGKRSLTRNEKATIRTWCIDWGYTQEIIQAAYEITADNTGEASIRYANAILDKWHAEGLSTIDEINKYLADTANKKKKIKKKPTYSNIDDSSASSFDTDDFFEAAIKRSYDGNQSDNKQQ